MGGLHFKFSKKIGLGNLYDVSAFLYILALYVFENQTYSLLFAIFQVLFVGMTFMHLCFNKRLKVSRIYPWMIAFLLLSVVSTLLNSVRGGDAVLSLIFKNIIRGICLTVYLYTNNKNTQKTVKMIAVSGLVCAGFIFAEFLGAGINYSADVNYAYQDRIGASIAGNNVNIVALNMSFAFAAWMYLFHEKKLLKEKAFVGICLALTAVATLLTGARKILLFYAAVYLVYVLLYPTKRSRRIGLGIVLVLIAYYALMNIEPLYYMIGHRVDFFSGSNTTTIYDVADGNRDRLLSSGLQMFYDRPILGNGHGSTASQLGTYAHNNFVELLASGGLIGALVYYSLYIFALFKSGKYIKQDNYSLYVFASVIGMCVLEFFQVTYLYGTTWVFITLMVTYCEQMQHLNTINPMNKNTELSMTKGGV